MVLEVLSQTKKRMKGYSNLRDNVPSVLTLMINICNILYVLWPKAIPF